MTNEAREPSKKVECSDWERTDVRSRRSNAGTRERSMDEIASDIIVESRKRLSAEQELHFLTVELLGTITHKGKPQNE